jgi:hypothetical protein
MKEIALPPSPVGVTRRLVLVGLIQAFAVALAATVHQLDVSKQCRGGAFSSAFASGFDVRRCDLVVRKIGSDAELRIPLPP